MTKAPRNRNWIKSASTIVLLLLLAFFSVEIKGGHIYVQDPVVDVSNLGSVSIFDFRFMLETGLPSTGKMVISFPFSLPPIKTASSYWFSIEKGCLTPEDRFQNKLDTSLAGGGVLTLNFKDLQNVAVSLEPSRWYNLHIEVTNALGTALVGAVGNQIPVTAFTRSNPNSDYIVYDSNPNFALFRFTDASTAVLDVFPFLT